MAKIIGVRFKPAGKIYDFDPGAFVPLGWEGWMKTCFGSRPGPFRSLTGTAPTNSAANADQERKNEAIFWPGNAPPAAS